MSLDSILNFAIPLGIIGFFIGVIVVRFKEPLGKLFIWVKELFGSGAERLDDATTYTQIVYTK